MPNLGYFYAGRTIEFEGVFYKRGVATSLAGATMRASIKTSPDDLDAAVLATITTTLTASGQITLTTGDGVANAGYVAKFLPAATEALEADPPDGDVYPEVTVKEADGDEYTIFPPARERATMRLITPVVRTI
jgi:hypothetical protein